MQCAQIACVHDEIMQLPMSYESLVPSEAVATEQSSPPMENSREIEHLTKLLSVAERQIEDIKEDRNEWRKQANTLLIENLKTKKKGLFGLW